MSLFKKLVGLILKENNSEDAEDGEVLEHDILDDDIPNNEIEVMGNFKVESEDEGEDDEDSEWMRDKIKEDKKALLEKQEKLNGKPTTTGKKGSGNKNTETWNAKTSERNLHREVGGMEVDYELVSKLELENRSNKRKIYKKLDKAKKIATKKLGRIRALQSFGLECLKKQILFLKAKRMLKGMVPKAQIKKLVFRKNVNLKKIKVMKKKIVAMRKKQQVIMRRQMTTMRQQRHEPTFVQKLIMQANQKKAEKNFIKRL
jgi:hypothetical protein